MTHELPLEEAPRAYELLQKKEDGCIKVVSPALTILCRCSGGKRVPVRIRR